MRGVAGSQPMRTAVQITWHGAQINFRDLTPYLTYGGSESSDIPPAPTLLYSIYTNAVFWTDIKRRRERFFLHLGYFLHCPWFTWQDSCCVPSPLNPDNILTHWSCSQDVLSHMLLGTYSLVTIPFANCILLVRAKVFGDRSTSRKLVDEMSSSYIQNQ
jgi:hypothetical protein